MLRNHLNMKLDPKISDFCYFVDNLRKDFVGTINKKCWTFLNKELKVEWFHDTQICCLLFHESQLFGIRLGSLFTSKVLAPEALLFCSRQ